MNLADLEASAPFDLPGGSPAVLCLHGLTGTPYIWRPLAAALAAAGHRVKAPRLVGHGMTPGLLRHTRFADWLGTARRAFDELARTHDPIFVVGHSMGALAAITLAHERGDRVAGLVVMATALEVNWKQQLVLSIARHLPLADAIPYVIKKSGPDVSDPAVAAALPTDDRTPIAAAASLLDGQAEAKRRLPLLGVPVLVQHGRQDHVAPVQNAREVLAALRTPHKRAIVYPRSWHILSLDVEQAAVTRDVLAFIEDPVGFTRMGPPPLA